MSVQEQALQAAANPKIAAAVSLVTTSTGVSTWLSWIPDDIGKLATLVGIALSVVLIYTHLRKGRAEYQKLQLEIEILREKQAVNPCDTDDHATRPRPVSATKRTKSEAIA